MTIQTENLPKEKVFTCPSNEKRIVVDHDANLHWLGFGYGGHITSESGGDSIPRERKCIQRFEQKFDNPRMQKKFPQCHNKHNVCAFRMIEPHHVGAASLTFVNYMNDNFVAEYIEFIGRKFMAVVLFPWQEYQIYSEKDFRKYFKEVV